MYNVILLCFKRHVSCYTALVLYCMSVFSNLFSAKYFWDTYPQFTTLCTVMVEPRPMLYGACLRCDATYARGLRSNPIEGNTANGSQKEIG